MHLIPKLGRDDIVFFATLTSIAVVYGIGHDQITATLSPEYFLLGKGLVADTRPFRWAVALLAANASWPLGILAAFGLRFANEPSEHLSEPLSLRMLFKFSSFPLIFAAICAISFGLVPAHFDPWAQKNVAETIAGSEHVAAFVRVWRIHIGSYFGGTLGLLVAMFVVRRKRRTFDLPRA